MGSLKGMERCTDGRVAPKLRELGLEDMQVYGETIIFNGASEAAEYYRLLIDEVGVSVRGIGFSHTGSNV